jgi:tetratricopeptide (TPR) repeat protein
MSIEIIQVNSRRPLVKAVLILGLILALIGSYSVIRWYIGNTLAEYFNVSDNNLNLAQVATSLAPKDPLTHWRLGLVSQSRLPLDQQTQSIAEFEKAVSLSPHDYRFWMALGTALEQSGNPEKGEQAFRRSISLAPSYAYPHWYLGNLLLRSGRYDEAFAELQIAAATSNELRPQLFNLAWAVYGTTPESLKNAVGPDATMRGQFASYLLGQKNVEEGLQLWDSLSGPDKKRNRDIGDSIVTLLINGLRFHDAQRIWNDIAATESYRAEVDRIFDGGFESTVSHGPTAVFAWQVLGDGQVQIGIDPGRANSGSRSLRLNFQVRSRLEGINASQLVATTPDKQFDFECYVRTDKLESGTTPRVAVVDATDGAVLATSDQVANGTNDWSRIGLSFKTGPKTQAVRIKLIRQPCLDDNTVCPIFGSIWYDDFSFKRRD